MDGKRKKVEELAQVYSEEKPNEEMDLSETCIYKLKKRRCSKLSNSTALEWRSPILGNVMEALVDPHTHLIGVYGSDDDIKDTLLQRVNRRIQRDGLFDLVLTANVTRKPDMKKIQEDIAPQLGLPFIYKFKYKRAQELIERIKTHQKILMVFCDLHKGLDLGKVGIPYGLDHTGCKILLTSPTEDVLSNHMRTQKNFMV